MKTTKEQPRIKTVFQFGNGMVAVTDQYGEQMPDYQGTLEEVRDKINRDAGDDVEWNGWPGK